MTISINGIKELVKLGLTIEAQQQIMELKESELSLKDENLELKKQLDELREKLSVKEDLIFDSPFYYRESDTEKNEPYCSKCYDAEEKRIHIMVYPDGGAACKECGNFF